MTAGSAEQNRLAGLKLLVTAIDLEQSEHRGIAVYSKALLKALKNSGAEVWLLSEFDVTIKGRGSRHLASSIQKQIQCALVLEALAKSTSMASFSTRINRILKKLQLKQIWNKWNLKFTFKKQNIYRQSHLVKINLSDFPDNPYLRVERLDYLQWVDGIVVANKLFGNADINSLGSHPRQVRIDLAGFDACITTCPLNIRPINTAVFVQTIHDIIPLEYVQTSDSMVGFSRRLEASRDARKIFISRSTALKFDQIIPSSSQDPGYKIIVQPPSLHFDLPLRSAFSGEMNFSSKHGRNTKLTAQKFFLFNSSIEPRKNVQFLIKAFQASGLGSQGWKLCITGKFKEDSYSHTTMQMADTNPDIILTGYIDEFTKHNLYLATAALLSPSLVEGFGIPVLDAACLGLPAIASPSDCHAEIKNLYDFNHLIRLKSTLNPNTWADAMIEVAHQTSLETTSVEQTLAKRLERYKLFQKRITGEFGHHLSELIRQPQQCRP